MKRFGIFLRNKREREVNNDSSRNTNDKAILEQPEIIEIAEDLDYLGNKKKNHETDDDAISIRSVDCKSKGSWTSNGIKKCGFSNISKSFSIREQTLSYRNLNMISEGGESPVKPKMCNNKLSKSMIICSPNKKSNKDDGLPFEKSLFSGRKTIYEDGGSSNRSPLPASGSTRHDSNSSTHSSLRKSWIETEEGIRAQHVLDKDEIDRQNIIYELLSGEIDVLNDLKLVIRNYKEPMEKLKLITESESFGIFYKIESIIPVYQDVITLLEAERDDLCVIKCVGKCLLLWSDSLDPIIKYCSHLYYSKSLLEEKRKEKDFAEFLQCCYVSNFSRKFDLWAFLDNPRSRLMRYPLLIERIIKSTHSSHADYTDVLLSLKSFEKVLLTLDTKTGEEMCKFFLEKLEFLEPNQYIPLVKSQRVLLIEGNMKIGRSINYQKIHAFLFSDVLLFTKPTGIDSIERTKYIVYGNPLPTNRLLLENIKDGEIKIGSFRSTFSTDNGSKNVFRLTLLSNFIPQSELEDQRQYHQVYDSLRHSSDKLCRKEIHENASRDNPLLKRSQTILQVSKSEEKQLWLSSLRLVILREIEHNDL